MDNHRGVIVQEHLPALARALEWVAAGIELAAVAILLVGFVRFAAAFVLAEAGADGARAQTASRILLAGCILAALEVFIVADLMMTALTLSRESLAFLGALVLIRSLVSWFLDREIRAVQQQGEAG